MIVPKIVPYQLTVYLSSRAWKQVEEVGDRATFWRTDAPGGEEYEILLPLDPDREEYDRRISKVLQTLADAEQRSQFDIASDIIATTADVLRVRLVQEGLSENSTRSLEHGVRMIGSVRELVMAAACAAVRPLPVYSSHKPQKALDYVAGLRLGPSEAGSFVLVIHSPIAPTSQLGLFAETSDASWDEPFERRVLLTLADALTAIPQAIIEAASLRSCWSFQAAVLAGVSANFCEALLDLSMDSTAAEIDLQISWSPMHPVADNIPTRFRIPRAMFPLLRAMSRCLRQAATIEDVSILGVIMGLHREPNVSRGRATVYAQVEDEWQKMRIELCDADYRKAMQAYEAHKPVTAMGKLVKVNSMNVLRNVEAFDIVDGLYFKMSEEEADMPEEPDPFEDW